MNFHSIKKKSSITKPVSPISRFKRQKQHGTNERGGIEIGKTSKILSRIWACYTTLTSLKKNPTKIYVGM
jgi:hypothetical protein